MLACNRGQHGTDLTSFLLTHDDRTLASHPVPFFISAEESQSLDGTGGPRKRLRQDSERQVRGDTSIR